MYILNNVLGKTNGCNVKLPWFQVHLPTSSTRQKLSSNMWTAYVIYSSLDLRAYITRQEANKSGLTAKLTEAPKFPFDVPAAVYIASDLRRKYWRYKFGWSPPTYYLRRFYGVVRKKTEDFREKRPKTMGPPGVVLNKQFLALGKYYRTL